MKVCKNCGRQTDDSSVRCPYCGHVFEEEIDAVLNRMSSDLKEYKVGYAAAPAPQPQSRQALPAEEQQSSAPQPSGWEKERFDMMASIAEMSGEIRALHNEIGRIQANAYAQQYPAQQYPAQQYPAQQYPAQQYPAQQYPAQQYPAQGGAPQPYYGAPKQGKLVRVRSSARIVLAVLNILLIAASIALFFRPWVNFTVGGTAYSFKGFDAVRYLFGGGANFGLYLNQEIVSDGFKFASLFATPVRYVVRFGIVAYGGLMVLTFPVLFSLGGRFTGKAWHSTFAWLPFLVALLLFGLFCWVSGFSAVTWQCILGGALHLLRGILLVFYPKTTEQKLVEKSIRSETKKQAKQ